MNESLTPLSQGGKKKPGLFTGMSPAPLLRQASNKSANNQVKLRENSRADRSANGGDCTSYTAFNAVTEPTNEAGGDYSSLEKRSDNTCGDMVNMQAEH